MGMLSWLLGGAVALFVCRLVPLGRPAPLLPEAVSALFFALAGGLLATRLDFGGWNAAEPLVALFCSVTAFSGVALVRVVGVFLRSRASVGRAR